MNKKVITHLKNADPVLSHVIDQIELPVWKPERNYFRSLVESIIGQQLSTKAADTIIARFNALLPIHPYTPEDILGLNKEQIRAVGISYSKVSYIQDLAEWTKEKKLDLEHLSKLDDQVVMRQLIEVKGIGPWTAEMFMMFALGREDIFSFGDQGLKNAIKKLYNLKTHPTQKQALHISAKWKPYRTWACRYLWASLELK